MPASRVDDARIGLRLLKVYCGPNPYSADPSVLAALDLGAAALAQGPDRCARIAQACAPWFTAPETARQSSGREQDIAAFLAAWSLALLNKEAGYLHTAHAFHEHGQQCVCLGYHHEQITLAALKLAAELFRHIDAASPGQIEGNLQAFARLAGQHHPDYQIKFLMQAARAAGIPYGPLLREHRLWQFGWGRNANLFFESEPKGDSAIGWKVARDKTASKAIFASLGIRTAPHVLARGEADLAEAARTIGWPCVVKPAASGRSRGVTADVDSMAKLMPAFRDARSLDKGHVMIERQVEGDVYRIVIARGKTACVIRRSAPYVIGDGQRSLRELIDAANGAAEGLRAALPELVGPIPFDDDLQAQLSLQGLALDEVASAGRKVMLRRVPLLSTGAMYSDATAEAHPDISTMSVMLAASLGLEFCGIDFVSRDISRSCAEEGVVLEINTTPGMRVPLVAGMAAEDIGRMMLGDTAGRIPVTLVLATGSDLERLVAQLRFADDQGWVISDRCGLGTLSLADPAEETKTDAPSRLTQLVSRLLRNPLAGNLTIVCSPDEIAEAGLPVDRYDRVVACPTEINPAWREVLAERADNWVDAQSAADALIRLAAPQ